MYMNFWYPMCTSEELKDDEPLRSELLGMRFVVFRDDAGRVRVLSDTCVHRGGSLSKGKVVDGCVACPYHGWRFGGDGKCTLVPSFEEGTKPPARAKVDSYPAEERYGIVFAFLGDLPEAERPPLYTIEEYEDPAWRASEIMILNVDCYYERSMENGIDPVHNEFVHPVQGSPKPIPGTVEFPEQAWGSGVQGNYTEMGEKRTASEGMASDPTVLNAGSWHHGPNTLITWITFSENHSLHQYLFEAPISGGKTKIYFINLRSFALGAEHDERVKEANLRVTSEDIVVLENLYPVRTPDTRSKEILVPGDKAIVRYRDYLDDWTARGWKLDYDAIRAQEGDVAYAIPSPARRSSGNWVLDPAPVQAPSTKKARATSAA